MTWVQFDVVGARGARVTLGLKVKLEVVECWVGGLVVILDRDAFTTWLAVPDGSFGRNEVAFEPDPSGTALVVSFSGRVSGSVLTAEDVARLRAAVGRETGPIDLGSGFETDRTGAGTIRATEAGTHHQR